jgi:Double zinc ribbon
MADNYVVPRIYEDLSDQAQGYFAFRFTCQICAWSIDTTPIRSKVSTATNVMDIGVGLLGGFWGRAAEAGEQIYGSKWHQEQAQALQKAWGQIQHEFHLCPKCHQTVCMRCFNAKLNLCTRCAPDLKSDGASFQHELNIDAQRKQIEANYRAPQFNTDAVPSAVEDDMVRPPNQPLQQPQPAAALASLQGGYPRQVMCPTCRRMGPPGKFCEDCGTKLPLPDLFCPQCSSQVAVTSRFCPECGAKLQQAT